MKKVLIIEDDQVIANIYRNKFTVEGYQAEVAYDGESGLKTLRTFKPDIMLLDLILPKMSGVDFIIKVRSEADFAKLPIIVFSNTYLTNMIQEAWKAGANKCLSKTNCTPKDVLDIVRQTIGGEVVPQPAPKPDKPGKPGKPAASAKPDFSDIEGDTKFLSELRQTFIDSQPANLAALRAGLQNLIKANSETDQLKDIHELYRRTPCAHRQRRPVRFHARGAHVRRPGGLAQGALRKAEKHQHLHPPHRRRRRGFSRLSLRARQTAGQSGSAARQHPGGGRRSRSRSAPSFMPWKRRSCPPPAPPTPTPR